MESQKLTSVIAQMILRFPFLTLGRLA